MTRFVITKTIPDIMGRPVSIRDGWLDTVDRLARALADTPTITAAR